MKALLIVDVQNDFLPGGALAVPRGDEVVAVLNRVSPRFDLVLATQDWHPPGHGSFASSHAGRKVGEVIDLNGLPQILWPDHCVQGTRGAEFGPGLDHARVEAVFRKGTDPGLDSYSGLFDNGRRKSTGLAGYLRDRGVTGLYVCGLATDYCVKFTAIDAAGQGFRTHLLADASRGVNLAAGDAERAIEEMRRAGVGVLTSDRLHQ